MKLKEWLAWLPLATVVGSLLFGGVKFGYEVDRFIATYEDEEITRFEDGEDRDAKLEWLRDRMNELRQEHGKPLLGWSKGE